MPTRHGNRFLKKGSIRDRPAGQAYAGEAAHKQGNDTKAVRQTKINPPDGCRKAAFPMEVE